LGEKLVYELEVLLGYQRILDPRGSQTFEGGRTSEWFMVCVGHGVENRFVMAHDETNG
jgi:hypothetical protein